EIFQARWRREKNLIIFYIEANRFLYGMVRAIVGSLIKIHSTEKPEEELMKIIEKRNRSAAADSVPAKGLFLYKIKY
ncbi:MAG: tRNA pseudouridine(38-40) synthase TruA, partial [Ignavibacteriaceae bacterium]